MTTRTRTTGALAGAAALALVLTVSACGSDSSDDHPAMASNTMSAMTPSMGAPMPMTTGAERTGMFAGENGKSVTGTATISGDTLMLTGFHSDEGPDLHVYLTDGTDEAAVGGGKELGKVTYDRAAQSFSLTGADAAKYTHVVIHCDKAKAVFGAAMLS
ncbi:DM13 domain-containing protein [Gordonia sp. (in: high G+C Gram-positive bacteria)]|uniref:DM13 domain-containing protein n=1 Tax=Gordonia sp. (in: high G+C Gram-positive bacteria) TaxID=84139 RepID=UPI002622DE0C|nr:DM13 domain-containing protein [Gordonia sp. (in: high G+C Gram-positive bacteria)]